jgi:hypothetical protein
MAYTHRSAEGAGPAGYRVRLADSDDGWRFTDRGLLLDVDRTSNWDNEMTCYGWAMPEQRLLFYSGNGFGARGFGVAPLRLAGPVTAREPSPGQTR